MLPLPASAQRDHGIVFNQEKVVARVPPRALAAHQLSLQLIGGNKGPPTAVDYRYHALVISLSGYRPLLELFDSAPKALASTTAVRVAVDTDPQAML